MFWLLFTGMGAGMLWSAQISAQADLDQQRARAQGNLRIAKATEARIKADLERLEARGKVDPKVMEDYTIYLERVRGLVAEYDRIARELEAIYARTVPATTTPEKPSDSPFSVVVPEAEDELSQLNRELNDSLARFDAFINVEMAVAVRKMEEVMGETRKERTELASEAAEAVRRLRERGIDLETPLPEKEGAEAPGGTPAEEPAGPSPDGEGEDPEPGDEPGVKLEPSEEAGGDTKGIDPREQVQGAEVAHDAGALGGAPGSPEAKAGRIENHSSPEDDDIVARQLREAAENETDPVLQEKLWKEYEAYKKGV